MHAAYVALLADIGIHVDDDDISEPMSSVPSRCTTPDVTTWHRPAVEYVLDYEQECRLRSIKRRPVHRYCRVTRFAFVLGQLLGLAGKVPDIVKHVCRVPFDRLGDVDPSKVWNIVRRQLKDMRMQLYYNRIPAILAHPPIRAHLPWYTPPRVHDGHRRVMRDFQLLHRAFDEIRPYLKRSYFPNMRYVALRLMERHDLLPPYAIPFARTARKRRSLGLLFDVLQEHIDLYLNKTSDD